jgi:hypothetical protein
MPAKSTSAQHSPVVVANASTNTEQAKIDPAAPDKCPEADPALSTPGEGREDEVLCVEEDLGPE